MTCCPHCGAPADPLTPQQRAIVDTIKRALAEGGWSRGDLTGSLRRWRVDALRDSYVQLREKLFRIGPAAGFTCPVCQLTEIDNRDYARAGYCGRGLQHTGTDPDEHARQVLS